MPKNSRLVPSKLVAIMVSNQATIGELTTTNAEGVVRTTDVVIDLGALKKAGDQVDVLRSAGVIASKAGHTAIPSNVVIAYAPRS